MKKPSVVMTLDDKKKWTAGMAAFRKRHNLSLREFAIECGGADSGVSKATAERICNGLITIDHASRIKSAVIDHLHSFLNRRGLSEREVTNQLKSISTGEEYKAVIAHKLSLPFPVQQFYGLRRDPFGPMSDPLSAADAFTSPDLDRIAEATEDTINYQGFTAVVGTTGSGKSFVQKRLDETIKKSNGRMRLFYPDFAEMHKVGSGAVVAWVLERFDKKPRQRLVLAYDQLRKHLQHLFEQDVRIALAFDDAHMLNDEQISALKRFWELGTGGYQRFLGVLLFGQPLLKSRLDDAKFREIAERLTIIEMPSMSRKLAHNYLTYRFRLIGADLDKLFERKALDVIADQAETPLALGNLANAALIKAHGFGERRVLASMIESSNEPRVRAVRRAS